MSYKECTKLLLILFLSFTLITCNENDDPGPIGVIVNPEFKDGTRICLIGDTGMGTKNQNRVAEALKSENCDQIRILGDVIYEVGIQSATDPLLEERFFKPYGYFLEQNIPIYLVMGNHDHLGKIAPWIELAQKHKNLHFPNNYYAETYGDVCIFNLDSNKFFVGQGKWIKETFDELKSKCKLSLSMGHHPYFSIGKHGDAGGTLKMFLEDTAIGHLDAYFAGHDHNLSYEDFYSQTHLMVSGAGAKLRSLRKNPKPGYYGESTLGYLVLEIHRGENNTWAKFGFRALVGDIVKTRYEGTILGQGIRP